MQCCIVEAIATSVASIAELLQTSDPEARPGSTNLSGDDQLELDVVGSNVEVP
jgi:fructose-1,6-bisphosphatase